MATKIKKKAERKQELQEARENDMILETPGKAKKKKAKKVNPNAVDINAMSEDEKHAYAKKEGTKWALFFLELGLIWLFYRLNRFYRTGQ